MSKPDTKRNTISQTEARRLRKRVDQLETILIEQRRRYRAEYVGTVVASHRWDENALIPLVVRTARNLGHAVVVTENDGVVTYRALPHPEQTP